MPAWLVLPFGLLFVLGLLGLWRSIGGLVRLYGAASNAFEGPAAEAAFRFRLPRAGNYELACTRPGQFNRYFHVPQVGLRLRALPAGPEQVLRTHSWRGGMRNTNLSGETTVNIAAFAITAPGEYELLNPDGKQFAPGDRLRVRPATGGRGLLLIFAVLGSGALAIGGLVAGLIAGLGGRP